MKRVLSCLLCLCLPSVTAMASDITERSAPAILTGMVHCAGAREFRMRADGKQAVIWLGQQTLVLQRHASHATTRYSTANAALAIDGDYVAFVMDDALDFEECHLSREREEGVSTRM